jgi:hypothetical protein
LTASILPLKNVGWAYLTGGSEGTATSTDWSNALDKLQSEKVDILVPLTTDEGIQQLALAHVNYMSTNGRKERTMVVGHPLALETDVEGLLARARNFNSSRTVLASPGIMRYDRFGNLVELDSRFTACCYAGMAASSPVEEPLTFDYINSVGLTHRYDDSELDQLLLGGVAPVEFIEDKGYRIVQSLTTWLKSDNTLYREWSVQRIADAISIDVRTELEDSFVGTPGRSDTAGRIKNKVKTFLKEYIRIGRIISFTEPTVVIYGGVAYVEYGVSPTEPINYILVTTHFKPSRLTA